MKKLVLFTLFPFFILIGGCSHKNNVTKDTCNILIEAVHYPLDSIILEWEENNVYKQKTVFLKNGRAEVDLVLPEHTLLSIINLDKSKTIELEDGAIPAPMFNFFVENGHQVTVNFDNNNWPIAKISGGKVNTDYMNYLNETEILEKNFYKYYKQVIISNDSILQISLLNTENEILNKKKDFIQKNTSSYVSLYLLKDLTNTIPFEEFEKDFDSLSSTLKKTELGQSLTKYIKKYKEISVNQIAPYFEKKDRDGKLIKLSNYKGKYLLLDFWGSWCMPCRESHPHLVKLYEKYSPRGLQFINIAQESNDDRKDWLEAIEQDRLTWTQLLNNEDNNTYDLVSLYGITAFPSKILIAPDGKIAAKYIGDETEELDAKLIQIFGE